MTRIKKTRTSGPLAASKKERTEKAIAKGKQRGKGNKPGTRQQQGEGQTGAVAKSSQDKRLGSKSPISLAAPAVAKIKEKAPQVANPWPPKTKVAQQAALEQLENDSVFMAQLDVLDEGGILPPDEMQSFETKVAQYDWLMNQLGLMDDEEDEAWEELNQKGSSLKDEWL